MRYRDTDTDRFPEYVWLSKNVTKLRLERGFSQAELATKMGSGTVQAYVSALERMQVNPTLEVLSRLAAALETTISDLFREPADS